MIKLLTLPIVVGIALFLAACCSVTEPNNPDDPLNKVLFDLSHLDRNGLRGPPDGKIAVSYEFAIPDNDLCRSEIKAIDKTAQFMPGSHGRVGAGKNECLCIGSTHQENFKTVLLALAEKSYIKRIIECHFE